MLLNFIVKSISLRFLRIPYWAKIGSNYGGSKWEIPFVKKFSLC